MKHSISSRQYEQFEPFTFQIFSHTMHRRLVQLGVFGVIAGVVFVQAPVTTSWGAILHTEAENVQATWSSGNKAFSPYSALKMRSNELLREFPGMWIWKCNKNNTLGYKFGSDYEHPHFSGCMEQRDLVLRFFCSTHLNQNQDRDFEVKGKKPEPTFLWERCSPQHRDNH